MDQKTIDFYNQEAETIVSRHLGITPNRLYELIKLYFRPNGKTADIGCGSGRDTFWLHNHNFHVKGFDPSEGMLKQAKKNYPHIEFTLSDVKLIEGSFDNILFSAVLMHIPKKDHKQTLQRLSELLAPNGRMLISFKVPPKESDQRLFENYSSAEIILHFQHLGLDLKFSEKDGIWTNLVFERLK